MRSTINFNKEYQTFTDGIRSCLPTVLGYLGIGIAAGVVGANAKLSLIEIGLMSLFIYAGSAQFIICGLLRINSPISAVIFTIFLVNLRHFLMSLSASQYFTHYDLAKNIGIGSLLTDESYGVLMTEVQRGHSVSLAWMNGLNITAYLSWFFATMIGGVIGNWIPDPNDFGLDYALIAMFIGLFVLQAELPLKNRPKQICMAILTVCFSLYLLMSLVSAEIAVLLATLLGCGMGVFLDEH